MLRAGNGANCSDGVKLLVEPAFGTQSAIQGWLASLTVDVDANTDPALARARTSPALLDNLRPAHSILLFTDGPPNCAGDPTDVQQAVSQATMAVNQGISMFVVGLGELANSDSSDLDSIAQASPASACGGASCGGKHYYPAATDNDLVAQLNTIEAALGGAACDH